MSSMNLMQASDRNTFVDLDLSNITSDANASVRFYPEYKSRPLQNNDDIVEFPLTACDRLTINTFGDIRYFFTSASADNPSQYGIAIAVENPAIDTIVVVRGSEESTGNKFEAYLGYASEDFVKKGRKTVYSAHLMRLTASATENTNLLVNSGRKIDFKELYSEIRKRLPNFIDWRPGSPAYQRVMLELLGNGTEWNQASSKRGNALTRDGVFIGNGLFYSDKVYWTASENKIKTAQNSYRTLDEELELEDDLSADLE